MAQVAMSKFVILALLCYLLVDPVFSISNNMGSNDLLLGTSSRWHGVELRKQPAVIVNHEELPVKSSIESFKTHSYGMPYRRILQAKTADCDPLCCVPIQCRDLTCCA
ncbi:Uncharacterized protein Fot_16092 [Forsythia ovata]|uniref:Uncharacterized protein n=1 Tax=Forsythia ovata TaxID=205694 RepID=A0ABD1WB19_9LAMI